MGGDARKEAISVRYLNGSMKQLWREFCVTNPEMRVSYSYFTRLVPKRFKHGQKATDLCNICVHGRKYEAQLDKCQARHCGQDVGAANVDNGAQDEGRLRAAVSHYHGHKRIVAVQNDIYAKSIANPPNNTAILTLDFKENMILGRGPYETNRDFYNRRPMSVLGFYIVINRDGHVTREYIDFISNVLSHDSKYATDCIDKVMQMYALRDVSGLAVWSDCGPHFRSKEFLHHILTILPERCSSSVAVTMNYFSEYHGKSNVDGHFSTLSYWLKQATCRTHVDSVGKAKAELEKQAQHAKIPVRIVIYERDGDQRQRQKLQIEHLKAYLCFTSRNIRGKRVLFAHYTSMQNTATEVPNRVVAERVTKLTKRATPAHQDRESLVTPRELQRALRRVSSLVGINTRSC